MARQQSALTNLLSRMQDVTEKAETTEPLLSQQLYDTLRRANLMHTDNLLETGAQLVDRGFLSQAQGAEQSAHTNISELRQSVEHAAESVLGNEADALRYAQKELNDLANQVEREATGGIVNSNRIASGQSNSLARATGQTGGSVETNLTGGANNPSGSGESESGARRQSGSPNGNTQSGDGQSQLAQNNSHSGQSNSTADGRRGQDGQPGSGNQNGASPGRVAQAGQNPRDGQGRGARNDGGQPGTGQQQPSNNGSASESGDSSDGQPTADGGNAGSGGDRLRELVRQFGANNGGAHGAGGLNGPITGNNFVDWSDRMRDVEQVLESPDLRNQLATVRERVAAFRAQYRQLGARPDTNSLQVKVLGPMTEVRTQLQEDLARLQNIHSLVPLDHDPVPENYSELVRKYYEKLGGGQ